MAKEITAKCEVILHKIKTLKDGSHPIVLRINYLRKRKYYSIGEKANLSEWEKIQDEKSKGKWKEIRRKIFEIEHRAEDLIKEIEKKQKFFTFDSFEDAFFEQRSSLTVFKFFDQLIANFIQQSRVGNAEFYKSTKNEISRFRNKKDLSFDDINYSFLNRWETHLALTNTTNSISIYMRTLRSAYNKAIKEGIARQENYPFKDYVLKKEATVKRALPKEYIQKINEFGTEPKSSEWLAQKFFIFSYLCQGMAFSDLAFLKWSDIMNNKIYYKRIKTIRTSKEPKVISIKITSHIAEILDTFREKKAKYDDYIFPVLRKDMTPNTIKNTIRAKRKKYNKQLRKICQKLGIEGNITSYVARHSYATVLKKSGIPTSVISESLAHQTEQMTQTYLDSFDNEVIDAANEGLL